MDERLERALEFSNYMIALENQKRILKEKYKEQLIYYHNKGQFTITPNFITFLQTLINLKQTETILLDDNEEPISIEDLKKFFIEILNVYFQATNDYHAEYVKISQSRSVKSIVEL